jgi:hypothetical protein
MASSLYTLNLNWNSAGQFCSTVLHYVFDDAGYATSAQAGQALIDRWGVVSQAAWLAMLPDQVVLLSIKARRATGFGGFEAVTLVGSGGAGTRVGGISASGLNPVLIHYPIGRAKGRGKTFLPGCRESDLSAGIYTSPFAAAVAAQLSAAFNDLVLVGGGTPTAEFVVKKSTGSPNWWSVSMTMLSDLLGQQRRRQRPA